MLQGVNMTILRVFLGSFLLVLCIYTIVVISNHGLNLFQVFFGDILKMSWAGQFNLDFSGYLMLSAAWTAWRNEFSKAGLMLAMVAFFGGMFFLTIYLLYLSFQAKGDVAIMMMGKRAVPRADA
jgi:hypothetical protein